MFGLPEEGLFLKSGLRRRHHGHDPACKLGLAQRTPRPESARTSKRILSVSASSAKAHERARVLKPPFEVWRPLRPRASAGHEIGHRDGPWSFEKRLDFTEERLREPVERIVAPAPNSRRLART